MLRFLFCFVKQKTAYEMRISDWSSDVCSSDLSVDGDPVVVPQHDQAAELQMPGKTDGFVVDALHQAAVAGDRPGPMVDQRVAVKGVQVPLGDRHADRGRPPLPQRPGRRLDPCQLKILRVPELGSASCRERVFHYV